MRWRHFIVHHYRQKQRYSLFRQSAVQFYGKVRCGRSSAQALCLSTKHDGFTRYAGITSAHAAISNSQARLMRG